MVKNILLIDDDEDEMKIFEEALQRAGVDCACKWAKNWEQLLKEISFPLPDMIFLDLNMPRLNGFEYLANLKKNGFFSAVPVIIYSTGMNNDIKNKGVALGASECIAKEYSVDALANTLKRLISSYGNLTPSA